MNGVKTIPSATRSRLHRGKGPCGRIDHRVYREREADSEYQARQEEDCSADPACGEERQ